MPRSARAQDARLGELLTARATRGLDLAERDQARELWAGKYHRDACKHRRLETARAALERTMTETRAFDPLSPPAAPTPLPEGRTNPPAGGENPLVFPSRAQRIAHPEEGLSFAKARLEGPALAPGTALHDVARLRRDQVELHGHTAEADDARALEGPDSFARLVRTFAHDICEDLQFNKRLLARRHAVKLAALAIALADRLDRDAASSGDAA